MTIALLQKKIVLLSQSGRTRPLEGESCVLAKKMRLGMAAHCVGHHITARTPVRTHQSPLQIYLAQMMDSIDTILRISPDLSEASPICYFREVTDSLR